MIVTWHVNACFEGGHVPLMSNQIAPSHSVIITKYMQVY